MACNTPGRGAGAVFTLLDNPQFDMLLEPCKGMWSIVKPLNATVTNYVENPSFETGIQYWRCSSGAHMEWVDAWPISADRAYNGSRSLRVVTDTAWAAYSVYYATDPLIVSPMGELRVPPLSTYYGSLWVKACAGDRLSFTTGIVDANETEPHIERTTEDVATGEWQELRSAFTNQSATKTLVVGLYLTNRPAGRSCSEMLIDAAAFTEIEAPYFDGESSGASWNGNRHESTSVMNARCRSNGDDVYLKDLGFLITSVTGHGMPTVKQDSLPNANYGGAHYNRTIPDSRTIVMTGRLTSTRGLNALVKQHSALSDLVGFGRYFDSPQPFLLRYRLVQCDCVTSGVLEIPVVYDGGLEGTVTNTWEEKIELRLTAMDQLFWREPETQCVSLTANTTNEINYSGTAPTRIRMEAINPAGNVGDVHFTSIANMTLGSGIYLQNPTDATQGYANIQPGQSLKLGDSGDCVGLRQNCAGVTLEPAGTNYAGYVQRPASRPSEFMLIPGKNVLLPTVSGPGTPRIQVCWENMYQSGNDVSKLTIRNGCAKRSCV